MVSSDPRGWSVEALSAPWPKVELVPASAYDEARAAAAEGPLPAAFLLNECRALDAAQVLSRRTAAIDEAERTGDRDERLQAQAERSIDEARANHLDVAEQIALAVLESDPDPIARARATEGLGWAHGWGGDDRSSAKAAVELADAEAQYRALGAREWEGFVRFWRGNAVHFQRGELTEAVRLMEESRAILDPASPRRAGIASFLGDIYGELGEWEAFDAVLDAGDAETVPGDKRARALLVWSRARGASARRDLLTATRLLAEAERQIDDWFTITTGATFLGDVATIYARNGDFDTAHTYLRRAVEKDPDDEFVLMAEAELLARRGDPERALEALRTLGHQRWLEIRLLWRFDLLAAWATLRAGRDPGPLAARGLERAAVIGPKVATTGEPELVRLLAPFASRAGSPVARALLGPYQVRLLGVVSVERDGEALPVPAGLPGSLLRMVAAYPEGRTTEQVVDALWPDAGPRPLRDALSRLRARVGDLVVRDGERLVVGDAWVDLNAFRNAADDALADRREGLVLAALALWTGTPLPADPYAEWAIEVREALQRRRLRLLDLAAELHADRPDRAVGFLEQAIEAEPYDTSRHERLATIYDSLDRPAVAERWRRRARDLD